VVKPVELRDAGIRFRVVLAKLGLLFARFVAAFEKLVPVIQFRERRLRWV
jgi:hypothetical protein